jgi:putative acetyltransferase
MREGLTKSSGVCLRAPSVGDLAVLMELRNDRALQELLLARPTPNTREDVQDWIARRASDPAGAFFVIAAAGTDKCLGFCQLTEISAKDAHAHFGICLAASARALGYGRQAMGQLIREVESRGI